MDDERVTKLVVKLLEDMSQELGDTVENLKRLLDIAFMAGYNQGYTDGQEDEVNK
jgi:hypothetical protein